MATGSASSSLLYIFGTDLKAGVILGKILTIPVLPDPARRRTKRNSDTRYIEGQRLIVEAIRYLVKEDPEQNREAVGLLSEHFRTQFRMSDRPIDLS